MVFNGMKQDFLANNMNKENTQQFITLLDMLGGHLRRYMDATQSMQVLMPTY